MRASQLKSLAFLAAAAFGAPSLAAQVAVQGTVFDSVAGRPLAGAVVTAADVRDPGGTARSATADSAGHFVFTDVKTGTYIIGFIHPVVDSLGIEPSARRIEVGALPVRADLAIPGGRALHDAVCKATGDSTGALIGHMRDAITGLPIDSGRVVVQWSVITFANGQLSRALPTLAGTTNAEGLYAFCGLPVNTPVAVQGSRLSDSTGAVTLEVPPHGIARRDLFIAKPEIVTVATVVDSVAKDSIITTSERVHRGNGRVTGIARDAGSGRPLAGAQVTVEGTGVTATTSADGSFSLVNLPLGTQVLLARKVGYVPDEHAIDVLSNGAAHAEPRLVTIKALLDTVKVVGKRIYASDRNGFGRRSKGATGKFFDADAIEKIHPFYTSDILRSVLSVRVDIDRGGDKVILMRGLFGGMCTPNIWVDGFPYRAFSGADLDNMLHPESLAGVEVYTSPAQAPAEYLSPFSKCGTIVIWTK